MEDKYCTFCPEKSTGLTVTIGVGTLINDPFCGAHSIIDSPPIPIIRLNTPRTVTEEVGVSDRIIDKPCV